MYNITSFSQISNNFLPKIAREYNLITTTEESQTNKGLANEKHSPVGSPLISAGWCSSLFSNNHIQVHSSEDSSKKGKEKEKISSNFLQLIIIGSITAIGTGFGLGKLRSSIAAAEENIFYSRDVIVNASNWNKGIPSYVTNNIVNIANQYHRAEMDRKEKLYNYQYSLIGMATGISITTTVQLLTAGVLASAAAELIAIIGVITAVASAAFGAYQVAIHWDDFAKARDEFKNLNLTKLLPPTNTPPPPGWRY